jgi:hypothetical protein
VRQEPLTVTWFVRQLDGARFLRINPGYEKETKISAGCLALPKCGRRTVMATHIPPYPAMSMRDKGRSPPLIWLVIIAAAVVVAVWFLLETCSRLIGLGPTMLLGLVVLGAATWRLARMLRR